ncbi:MAG: restriction endonuclease subunit S [Clostridia bacterium]|nr:restriction endonuclease subunit S [Clostridia bacterium]
MSYPAAKLKDISLIKTGKLDSNAAEENGIYPFFTCDPQTLRINTWAYDTKAVLLAGNNASGNYTAKYYEGKFNAYQRTYIIESFDDSQLNIRYLCYAMNLQLQLLKTMSAGSTTKFLTIKMLHGLDIPFPCIETQNRIADILSAYDNLIENNQKQIKLLEEAAQRLYKEWFVDLRFLGYENTPIIDGVPQGWSTGILDDIAYESGKNEKKERRDNYNYYLPIDCLPKQSLGYTETADIGLAESSLVNFVKDDIIFGAMRPYFHKVVIARDSGLTRSTCFVLNSRQNEFWSYLAMLMFSKDTVDYATQISVGTTMPYARWKDLKQMPVIIPSKTVAEKFQSAVKPIIEKIGCLSKEIISLRQARDILLPKLMSGELEV